MKTWAYSYISPVSGLDSCLDGYVFFLQFSEKKTVQINSDLVEKEPRVNKIPNQDIKLGEVRVDHRLLHKQGFMVSVVVL